jgi:hypothetical protein
MLDPESVGQHTDKILKSPEIPEMIPAARRSLSIYGGSVS